MCRPQTIIPEHAGKEAATEGGKLSIIQQVFVSLEVYRAELYQQASYVAPAVGGEAGAGSAEESEDYSEDEDYTFPDLSKALGGWEADAVRPAMLHPPLL